MHYDRQRVPERQQERQQEQQGQAAAAGRGVAEVVGHQMPQLWTVQRTGEEQMEVGQEVPVWQAWQAERFVQLEQQTVAVKVARYFQIIVVPTCFVNRERHLAHLHYYRPLIFLGHHPSRRRSRQEQCGKTS